MESLVNPSPDFWRGRRVLVTGHTGFKGSWCLLWLRKLGAQVSGLALGPPSSPSLYDLACRDIVDGREVDVRDFDAVTSAVEAAKPEIVIHMAAQSLVRPSYNDPVTTYATNVMGTVHLFEAVRRAGGVKALVNITSDKCYENKEWVWAYREDDRLGGYDPYSNSKGCAELVTSAYRNSFFAHGATALASARAGNVIGGGDWAVDRVIPDCVRAFGAERSVEIRSPAAIRPWQHVLEPLCGYLMLAEHLVAMPGEYDEAWNFGPSDNDSKTVGEIVDIFCRGWGAGGQWHTTGAPQPHEAHYLKVDASKARARLGWRPRLTTETAVQWTAEWYRAHAGGAKARALCDEQIERFEKLREAV